MENKNVNQGEEYYNVYEKYVHFFNFSPGNFQLSQTNMKN